MASRRNVLFTLCVVFVCHSHVPFMTSAMVMISDALPRCPNCFKGLCEVSEDYTEEEVFEIFDSLYPNLLTYVPEPGPTMGKSRSGTCRQVESAINDPKCMHYTKTLRILNILNFLCSVYMLYVSHSIHTLHKNVVKDIISLTCCVPLHSGDLTNFNLT